ncbi:hypothetical protein ACA910_005047 [Epithemia clementina (nom. ined.)]
MLAGIGGSQSTYGVVILNSDAGVSMCLALCKGGTFCLNKAGCKLHFGSLQLKKERKMTISEQGIIAVLKTKKAAFVDPIVNRSKVDDKWVEDWKFMTSIKEEWMDRFILGTRLYAKRVMAKEELLFSIDGKQANTGNSLSEGGDEIFVGKDQEETTLDEVEVNTFLAEQFKTPKMNNKRKQIRFALEQMTDVQNIDFLPSLPENKDNAVLMLQSNVELHQPITVKLGKDLQKLGSQVQKMGTMTLQVDSDFQESTEKILIRLERLQVELGNSKEANVAIDHKAPTIWGSLSALSSAVQSLKDLSEDWNKDGSTQQEELKQFFKMQNNAQDNLRTFKEGVKHQLEKLKVN